MNKAKIKTKNKASESGEILKPPRSEATLREKIAAGEWEALPLVESFWERSPDGQVVAIRQAVDNRISQLRKILPELLDKNQRSAYIQILDYINYLEKKKDDFTVQTFSKIGKRKLEEKTKDGGYY